MQQKEPHLRAAVRASPLQVLHLGARKPVPGTTRGFLRERHRGAEQRDACGEKRAPHEHLDREEAADGLLDTATSKERAGCAAHGG